MRLDRHHLARGVTLELFLADRAERLSTGLVGGGAGV